MNRDRAGIVSSAHLVSKEGAEVSEVEYSLIVANNGFGLWCVRGTAAAIAEFPVATDLGCSMFSACTQSIIGSAKIVG